MTDNGLRQTLTILGADLMAFVLTPRNSGKAPVLVTSRAGKSGSSHRTVSKTRFDASAIPLGVPAIQTKLKVGESNDRFEQEADRAANAVMRMPTVNGSSGPARFQAAPASVQRMCSECRDEEQKIQRMPANESRPPRISTLDSSNAQHRGPRIGSSVKAHVKEIKGGGQPLPASVRGSFEGRFGCDFSDVRIHTNADAEVGAIHARAFSRGTDIVFGSGQYAPQTKEGQRLLAHELTHVIQQRNATSGRDVIRRAPAPKKPAYQDCTESTTTLTNPKGELIRALDLTLIHEAAHSIGLGMTTKHPPYRGSAEYPLGAGPPGKDETAAIRMDNPDAYGYFAAHVWRDIDTECRALSEIIEVKGSTPAPAVPGKSKEAR